MTPKTHISSASRHIAFLHKRFPHSGAEVVTDNVATWLATHGWRVTILTQVHCAQADADGATKVYEVHMLPAGKLKTSGRVARAVREYIATERVQVMVTCQILFYANMLRRRTGVKVVYMLHNTFGYEYAGTFDKKEGSLAMRFLLDAVCERLLVGFYHTKHRYIYRHADAYGVLADAYREQVVRALRLPTQENKLWVLPNAVALPERVAGSKRRVVLFAGRLSHRDKRVDRLLRIWLLAQGRMQGWSLKIVGTGAEEAALRELAEELRLERCSFEGHTHCMAAYYDEASVLCLTSSFEGWPMVVAEAQAFGVVPVLFNSFAAASEMVASEDEGRLVPAFHEEAFADALVGLVSDTERLRHMSQCVRRKAATYTMDRSGEAWLTMLGRLLSQ